MKRIILSVFAVLAGSMAFAVVDGWLEWVGDVKGGNWSETANWQIQGTSSYSVSELLSKSTGYDLSRLTDGAVVTNDLANLLIGELHLYTPNAGTITLTSTNKTENVFPNANVAFYIAGGTTLEWQLDHSSKWEGNVQGKKLIIMDAQAGAGKDTGGTFHMNPKSGYDTYKQDLQPCGHTTVILGKNFNSTLSFITMWNTATLKLEKNITVACVTINSGCKVDLNGYNLTICGGEAGGTSLGVGQLTGKGDLFWYGGYDWSLGSETTPTSLAGYEGHWSLYEGQLTFPSAFTYPSTLGLAVDGAAMLTMKSDATLYNLIGKGTTGGPRLADGTTLTLTANEATNGTFSARIAGNANVIKDGAGYDLTLAGDNRYTGMTEVNAGTLAVKRPHLRRGLVRYWSFEDADNLLRDYSEWNYPLGQGNPSNPATQIDDGVGGGKAIHFSATDTSLCFIQKIDATQPEAGFPVKSMPVSISLWLRPQSMPTNPTFIWRHGRWSADGGQVMLCGMSNGKKLQLCIDNWPGAAGDPNWPIIDTPDLLDGRWHHVVISYHDNQLEMWYDGVRKANTTGAHTLDIRYSGTNADDIYVGSNETGKRYIGDMDEVCLWDHALSAEEVAAEYSLANRDNVDPLQILPQPVCHWRFDDPDNIGKDDCGAADLVANSNVSTAPSLQTLAGGYGSQLKYNASMRLPASSLPERFPKGKVPFTVSVRVLPSGLDENNTLLQFGDATDDATDGFRLWNTGCPRKMTICSGSNHTKSVSPIGLLHPNVKVTNAANFTHLIIACNPITGLLRVYRDGVLETTIYNYNATLGEADLVINAKPNGTTPCSVQFDDLQIFDEELSPYEVRLLTASLETGKVGEVIPATSDVTVDAGATLKVDAPRATLKSVAGAGEVSIGVMSQLAVGDLEDFTGTVSGKGALVVDKALPTGPTVTSDVVLGGGDIAVGDGQLVETTGRVLVANAGRLVFAEEPAKVPYRVVLAKGSEVVLQGSLDGWTSNLPEGLYKVKFSTANGELVATVVNRGLILLVK